MQRRLAPLPTLLVLLSTLAYYAFVVHNLSLAYLDFGDGNYLYISARMADGAALYSEILSPQPPLHLWAGAGIFKLTSAPLPGLWIARFYTATLHVLTAALVLCCSLSLFGRPREAALAYALALFLPIGFWWTLGFQSEATALPLLLLAFYGQLRGGRGWMAAGGLAAAGALLTNMTCLPYVILHSLSAASLRRKHAPAFFLPLVGVYGGVAAILQWTTGGAFFTNIWRNQVGSFPPNLWDYGPAKLLGNGMVIVDLEGAWILLALGGMLAATRLSVDPDTPLLAQQPGLRRYVLWVGVLHLGSILFMLKGGTANYIFMIAEPMVALFAARAVGLLAGVWRRTIRDLHPAALAARALLALTLACLLVVPTFRLHAAVWMTNWRTPPASQTLSALSRMDPTNSPEREVRRALALVESHARPGDLILAPPWYAFASRTRLPGDNCETYLIGIRYANLRAALAQSGETLSAAVTRLGPAASSYARDAVQQLAPVVEALNSRQVKVVFWQVDRGHPFYAIPELRQALEENYQRVPNFELQNANERLVAYLPRD
ncbi:hypothetical protein HS125_19190 [bacterium]|nr:hypothetical protein [bacterium]